MLNAIHSVAGRRGLIPRNTLLVATLAVVAVAVDTVPSRSPDSSPSSARAPAARTTFTQLPDASLDVSRVIKQVRYAFQPDGGAFAAGHATYAVRVEHGELELTPYDGAVQGSRVRFGPARLARGGVSLVSGPANVRLTDGRVEISTGNAVERLRCAASGVEQSWDFAVPPGGTGDLVVAVPVTEGTLSGASDAGLHLSGGWMGLRYGHATWVDAAGIETAVVARFEYGAIVLRVPAEVLEGSAYPATLDPLISPEAAAGALILGPASGDQLQPAISWDGSNHLVVWNELRYGSNWQLFGARVSPAGVPLGPAFQIGADDYDYYIGDYGPPFRPAVSWNGTNHVVFWSKGTCVGYCEDFEPQMAFDLVATRVSPSGGVLDYGVLLASYSPSRFAAEASWDGTNHLVVASGWHVWGWRVSPDLVVQSEIAINVVSAPKSSAAVAWNGTSHLVVWSDARSGTGNAIYGARVSPAGAVLDPGGFAIGAGTSLDVPAVDWNGTSHLVVWVDDLAGPDGEVRGARVGADGAVLDPSGFAIGAPADAKSPPALAWDGTDHLVVWATGGADSDVDAARVSAAGAVQPPGAFALGAAAGAQILPAASWNGSTYVVVWQDGRSGLDADVYGARLDPSGTVLDPAGTALATVPNDEELPSVSWDGTNYLVVWHDGRFGPCYRPPTARCDLYATRVSPAGLPLDRPAFAISSAGNVASQPRASWNGESHLVVWAERGPAGYDVRAARVNAAGAVLDPDGIAVSTSAGNQLDPAVSWGGSTFLVVWLDDRADAADVYGARVTANGVVLDPDGIPISTAAGWQRAPAASWNGMSHLVVWSDRRNDDGSGTNDDIYGARVSAEGVVLDPGGVAISTAPGMQYGPTVSWDGTNHLVVWTDSRNIATTWYDVYGSRVSADAVVRDPGGIAIAAAPGYQSLPVVVWDGASHVVAWENLDTSYKYGVYGARVGVDGTVSAPGALGDAVPPEMQPGLAAAAPGSYLVAYRRPDLLPGFESGHVFVRAVTNTASAPPVAASASVTVAEDTPAAVALQATDPDGDPLAFRVASPPAHGTLTGTPPALTYLPASNYFGRDAFTFVASDGTADSAPATVSITVVPVNDAPVASGISVTVAEDGSVATTLAASDAEGDARSYQVTALPAHGTLSGVPPDLTYTPAADYHGPDAFTFVANDGTADSAPATVSITVIPVNDPPVATPGAVTVAENGVVEIMLAGFDVDGDLLAFAVSTPPAHGTLAGTLPVLTYTPAPGYRGPDQLAFTASDGSATSEPAAVSITVGGLSGEAGSCGCTTGSGASPLLALVLALAWPRRSTAPAPRQRSSSA